MMPTTSFARDLSPQGAKLDQSTISKLANYLKGAEKRIGGSNTLAVEVRDAFSSEVLFKRNSTLKLIPASVAKLFTSVLALKVLGGSYRFPLEVFSDSKPGLSQRKGGGIGNVGNLYVRGYGDPTLVDERIWFVAKTLKEQGVREVRDLVLDDTLFVNARGPQGYRAYDAGLGALTVNHNSYAVHVAPASSGSKALVSFTPGAPLRIKNQVRTVAGSRVKVQISQNPKSASFSPRLTASSNENYKKLSIDPVDVVVSGSIGEHAKVKTIYRSAPDPTYYFAGIFRAALENAGIRVKGDVLVGETSGNAELLRSFESRELALILRELNQYSNNITAGQILFLLGQDSNGYFRQDIGLKRIEGLLGSLGDFESRLYDGSGLDRKSRVSVETINKLLVHAANDLSVGPELISSLSRYKRSGTLKRRKFAYSIIVNGRLAKADATVIERRIAEILLGES
jgi:D-alanyl-D-alanine carboxypeptidase/D-alanyl-D-alanine-endopeptidase (penicillin-binding protein 4)